MNEYVFAWVSLIDRWRLVSSRVSLVNRIFIDLVHKSLVRPLRENNTMATRRFERSRATCDRHRYYCVQENGS